MRNPSALVRDAERREAKPGGGDAGDFPVIVPIRQAAVFHETGLRMGALLKKPEAGALKVIEKFIVRPGQNKWDRADRPPFGNPTIPATPNMASRRNSSLRVIEVMGGSLDQRRRHSNPLAICQNGDWQSK